MSFKAQLTGFGYGNSMTGEGWPDYVTLDNGGILSVEYETRTYYPVDRYALLVLADKARKLGDEENGPASFAVRCTFRVFARNIYKALGVGE